MGANKVWFISPQLLWTFAEINWQGLVCLSIKLINYCRVSATATHEIFRELADIWGKTPINLRVQTSLLSGPQRNLAYRDSEFCEIIKRTLDGKVSIIFSWTVWKSVFSRNCLKKFILWSFSFFNICGIQKCVLRFIFSYVLGMLHLSRLLKSAY